MSAPKVMDFPVKLSGRIKNERRWVAWMRQKNDKGRWTRVPYDPNGTGKADVNHKPNTWGTRAEAEGRAEVLRAKYPKRKVGIGIVLGSHKAASTPLGGFDLDTCFEESGELKEWAAQIVSTIPTWWEKSPSGTGLHGLFLHGDVELLREALKQHGARHNRPDHDGQLHPPGIDIFVQRGYFTVTEEKWTDSLDSIKHISADDLVRVIEQAATFGENKPKRINGKPEKDETRSGRAWRLALRIVAMGKGKKTFLKVLYEDEDLADWAQEKHPYNEDRAWKRAFEKYGWMAEWTRHENGKPISNLDNAIHALRNAEELKEIFAYDMMARAAVLMKPVPGSKEYWNGTREVSDVDVSAIQEFLQDKWLSTLSKDTTHQAVELYASEHPFHPVREYLKKLSWDREERLESWLSVYMGAEQTPYTAAVGKMFFISIVARIFKPGCKCDYMLIFEGEQGTEKSTACGVIAGEWFSDNLPNVRHGDKDVSQHLNGKWLIEVSEMSAMSKADAEALKSFLTRRHERYRPPYGRKEVNLPRQCVFAGTTNKKAYLRDETGNRRFWPIGTGTIGLDGLRRDRDQLFAEAVVLYQRGEPWWPESNFEAEHIKPEQDARFEEDPWKETIYEYLALESRTTIKEIATAFDGLNMEESRVDMGVQRRIAAILRTIGWTDVHSKTGNYWAPVKVVKAKR